MIQEIEIRGPQSDAWVLLTNNTHPDGTYDEDVHEILYGGAAGGGKSFLGCLWHITMRTTYPGTRGLIGRYEIKRLEESTLITYFKVCDALGYRSGTHYQYNQQKNFIKWYNGSRTILKDLKQQPSDVDFTSLGSTEYTDAFIDEATEITFKAFDILKTRLRHLNSKLGVTPKILLTCNPSPGWVKQRYIKDKDGEPMTLSRTQHYIHASVTDNPDEGYARSYAKQLEGITNPYDRARLRYGDWDAAPRATNPFAYAFIPDRHVSTKATFQDGKRIYVTLDFNIEPFGFNFSHKWRDLDGYHWHIFEEVIIHNGDIEKGVDEINKRFSHLRHLMIITGDKMGDKRDFGRRDKASYYQRIKNGLRLRDNQIETPANPTHENSRQDVNYVLYYMDDFKVHPSLKETIYDLQSVECDAMGKIIKSDRKNKAQRADLLDCVRYGANDEFIQAWIAAHQKKNGTFARTPTQNHEPLDLSSLQRFTKTV